LATLPSLGLFFWRTIFTALVLSLFKIKTLPNLPEPTGIKSLTLSSYSVSPHISLRLLKVF